MLSADLLWEPVPRGTLVAVVGPSGSGKDTLIDYARARLAADRSVLFVRRVVTRPSLPSAEDHDSLPLPAFMAARAAGAFAVTWEAHGLHYAIPAEALRHVAGGGVAVANGSRAALPEIRSAFGRVITVSITCRPEVLAARLAARGREDGDEQERRKARGMLLFRGEPDSVEIDNSGDVSVAGEALVAVIRRLAAAASAAAPGGAEEGASSAPVRSPPTLD
ncbi:MAG: phosphonate metabolism protein/1,5-bisphosphokinase (PRPP-forming) PhnN [Rhizobiales bacterium]|nr:phosphonate metabolism protein/1,5-bisphosphokinase (PRPP-forming) PhnN [Hyphomicrobiales bacterium]